MGSDWGARASRLRWRLRGGTMWPAFALATLADGLLLHYLPPLTSGVEVIPGVIVASFVNLFLLGAVAPWFARRLAARQTAARAPAGAGSRGAPALEATATAPASPSRVSTPATGRPPPYEVLLDRFGTALLLLGTVGLVAAGLGSRPLIVTQTDAMEINAKAVRSYALGHGNAEIRANLDAANTLPLAEGYFRTCIPRTDRRSAWCLFVDTKRRPPDVREDRSATPNDKYVGRR